MRLSARRRSRFEQPGRPCAIRQAVRVKHEVDRWSFGLNAWIIQDGNYAEFSRGATVEFAAEFHFDEPPTVVEPDSAVTCSLVGESIYEVEARVVGLFKQAWVVDVGIEVFEYAAPPRGLRVGDMIAGRVYLGIDPFEYFERLHAQPGMPPLVYTWLIASIRMETAPWVEVRPGELGRDPAKRSQRLVDSTDAWNHDGGAASYLLDCARLDRPPKRTSTTAT
jgi:hypothetical protein